MPITGYAAESADTPISLLSWEPRPLSDGDIEVAVSHCGLCHSDTSMLRNEWGMTRYPIVPGHEIVGTVSAVGASVRHLKPGQRVGVGWQSGSCGSCEDCRKGDPVFCGVGRRDTIVHGRGGFAEAVRVDGRFAVPIPDAFDAALAAPLMCGGITVYNGLMEFGVRPGMKVGVIGIGGLGHLALQFARAMGCEVTAFSTTPDKEAEARAFGAHHFVATRQDGALDGLERHFDVLLNTVAVNLPWHAYFALLRPRGQLITVGIPSAPMKIPAFSLIAGQKSLGGSPVGSPRQIEAMLDFASTFDVAPKTERMSMSDLNAAIARLDANEARYRIVLEADFT